ncbi:MAG: glycosyltransferase family 2 protein [Actinomycetota bacterium]|nr:glycosyltransferase family 2 protein [Actinomycetota bacterium]
MNRGSECLSVVVCTSNEAGTIQRCIRSVNWADEIVVVDSGSTDGTRNLAAAAGARVLTKEWTGFSAQKNFGASRATHDWILSLDADEVVTAPLAASIRTCLSGNPSGADGFAVDRRNGFLGTVLPNLERRGNRPIRLYNRAYSAWDLSMPVHERVSCPGEMRHLDGILLHWRGFRVDDQVRVFARNAPAEAHMLQQRGVTPSAAKVVYRPVLRFLWCYVAKGAWRCRGPGLVFSAVKGFAELLAYARLYEQCHGNPPDPPEELVQDPERHPVKRRPARRQDRPPSAHGHHFPREI